MTSLYTSSAADLLFPLKLLVSYDTNKFLRTSSKDVKKVSHALSWFLLGYLLGPLGPADHPLAL